MKRVQINNDYIEALHRFTKLVQSHKNKNAKHSDYYTVYSQTGRKFDKIMMLPEKGPAELLFFVQRDNGEIYGKKNPIQPNPFWFFNTIYTAHLWDWQLWFPKPVKDPSVKIVLEYGSVIKHYKLKSDKELATENIKTPIMKHKALDMNKVHS